MPAGLSTPLHLAANLLALFAAAGLALLVLASDRRAAPGPTRWLVAAGALAVAVGHGIDGALLDVRGQVVPWLLAGGLAAVAVGLVPARMPLMASGLVVVPVVPTNAAVLGAVAGVAAGLRALVAGPEVVFVGLGLLAWGTARGLSRFDAAAAAAATVLGALLLSVWLWQASRSRLLARLVAAFIASLLVLVVLLAVVLSTLGSAELVDDELRNLGSSSAELTRNLSGEWPVEAIDAANILSGSAGALAGLVEAGNDEGLRELLVRTFGAQDFLAILSPDGNLLLSAARVDALEEGSFLLALPGSRSVSRLLDGERESGGLITVGGQVVALGGILVFDSDEVRAEDDPAFVVVTGRIADDFWASQAASRLPFAVFVEIGGQVSAASAPVAGAEPAGIVAALDGADDAAQLELGASNVFAAARPLLDPETQEPLGRIVTARSGEVLAQVERAQARQLFILALVGAVVSAAVAAIVARRLVAPIRRLTFAAAAVREGDLAVRAHVDSPDEVGDLGRTFDEMTTSLAAQSAALREAANVQSRLRARLEALNASMSDGLVAVDADGKVVTFNPAAEQLVGRDVRDVLGLPLEEVLVGRGPAEVAVVDALGTAASERVVAVQLLLDTGHGRFVPTAATGAPVRDSDGTVLGRVFVLRDVTREAQLERMKSEFLSNVSHELRTPLTPIKGYAEVLARRQMDPEATRRFADQILDSTVRLERIVAMIVDFVALDSGRMRPAAESVALGDLVATVLVDWRAREPERTFELEVPVSVPEVHVDPAMLRRCLEELLDNAVKFSPGGEPISFRAVEAGDGQWVRLSVQDQGVGLDLDAAAQIFGDFYQVDASETRHFGGLGLGLALVRRIIDALGGDATVESEPGAGATVHLLLPRAATR